MSSNKEDAVSALDKEIAKLQKARALLLDEDSPKLVLSEDSRRKISEAVKERHRRDREARALQAAVVPPAKTPKK